jgi:hypothetical protein
LIRYLKEFQRRYPFRIKDRLLVEKLSYKCKGLSEIGLIVSTFFILVLLMIPMNLMLQEFILYEEKCDQVRTQTEMAVLDTLYYSSPDALSEGVILLDNQIKSRFEKRLKSVVEPIHALEMTLKSFGIHQSLGIRYAFEYRTQIVFANKIAKWVEVDFEYVLPINR